MKPKEMILTLLDHMDEKDHYAELKVRDQFGELQDIQLEVVYFHYTNIDSIDDDEMGETEECLGGGAPGCRWCVIGDVAIKAVVIEEYQ